MATTCLLTTGFPQECDDATGGLKQNSFLVTQFENITAYTNTSGEITAMTQAAGTSFLSYEIKKEIMDFVSTENHDPVNGTYYWETVLNIQLNNMSKEKSVEMKLLAAKPLVIIVQDNNSIYHIFGLEFGMEKFGGTNQAASGKAFGDMNGYTLGFTDKSKNLYTVSTGLMATILIEGVNS